MNRNKTLVLIIFSIFVASAVLLSGCAASIMSFLNPRSDIPGSILFVGYNMDTERYELRKHNIATGNIEVEFVLPESGLDSPDGITLSAFDYSEKHKTFIIDWRYDYEDALNAKHMLKTYVKDEEGLYVEDRTLFEDRDDVHMNFRYFNYVEQIDRLCVGIDSGIYFINLETGETEDQLQLAEDIRGDIAFDWNSDFTELVYKAWRQDRVYSYDMETGMSRRLPCRAYYTPHLVQDDSFLISDYGSEPDEGLFSGEILHCHDLEALETAWEIHIKHMIVSTDASPDRSRVAVQAYKFGWFITRNKLPIYIIDAYTGKTILKLSESEAMSEGIMWIE
jgi:hypothetical protein